MSGSTKLLAGAAGAAAGGGPSTPFWTEKIESASTDYTPQVDYDDSNGDVYFSWKSNQAGSNNPRVITKYDSNGVQQWSKSIVFTSSASEHTHCVGEDAVYLATRVVTSDGTTSNNGFLLVGLNKSDGSVAFQKFYDTNSTSYLYPRPIEMVDIGGTLFIGANVYRSSTNYANPLRIGIDTTTLEVTAGTTGDNMHYLTGTQHGGFMAYNPVSQVCASSFWDDTNNKTVAMRIYYSSAPYVQLQQGINVGGDTENFGCAVDNSGNMYFAHKTTSATYGGYDIVVTKYSSGLTLQWNKVLGNSGFEYPFAGQYYGSGIACDSDGNVLVAYLNSTEGSTYITKISSTGLIVGHLKISSSTSGFINALNIKASPSEGKLYVSLYNSANHDVHVAVLPTDLSVTGTYAGLTFGTGTVSITNRSYTTSSVSGLSTSPSGGMTTASSNAATIATFDNVTRTHEVIT